MEVSFVGVDIWIDGSEGKKKKKKYSRDATQ